MRQDQLTGHVQTLIDLMYQGYRGDWRAKTPVWRYTDGIWGASISAVAQRLEIQEDEALRIINELTEVEDATIIVYDYAPTVHDVIRPLADILDDDVEVNLGEEEDSTVATTNFEEKASQWMSQMYPGGLDGRVDPDARPESDYMDAFEKPQAPIQHSRTYVRIDCKSSQPIKNGRYDMTVNGVITVNDRPITAAQLAALMNMTATKRGS